MVGTKVGDFFCDACCRLQWLLVLCLTCAVCVAAILSDQIDKEGKGRGSKFYQIRCLAQNSHTTDYTCMS